MGNKNIIVIVDNVRSAHNIGSIFRTSDGLGVDKIFFVGLCPTPKRPNDQRLPHVILRAEKQIAKTAIGAETSVEFEYYEQLLEAITAAKEQGYQVVALEQDQKSIEIADFIPQNKTALVLGSEVDGITKANLELVDQIVEIPMMGKKESLNVAVSAAIIIYHCLLP